jgi:hypothetical protein
MVIKEAIKSPVKSFQFHFPDSTALKYITADESMQFCPNGPPIFRHGSPAPEQIPVIRRVTAEVSVGNPDRGRCAAFQSIADRLSKPSRFQLAMGIINLRKERRINVCNKSSRMFPLTPQDRQASRFAVCTIL